MTIFLTLVCHRLLREIAEFIKVQDEQGFLKALFVKEHRIAMIEGYHRRLSTAVASFQVTRILVFTSVQWLRTTTLGVSPARHSRLAVKE